MNKNVFYNLTKPQKSIWMSEQFSDTPANNIIGTMFFKNTIDILLLKKAVHLTVKNNQSLRTKLTYDLNSNKSDPQQYFDDFHPFDIPVIDLSSKSMLDFENFRENYCQRKFNLYNNFLFDFVIILLPNDEIALIGKFHHLIADAWGLGLVIDNIAINYTNLSNNNFNYTLNNGNYTDFILSENNYLKSDSYNKNKIYWENNLKDIEPLSIKTDFRNSNVANRIAFNLNSEDSLMINDFCKKNRISPYALFLTALQIYLYRTTSQENFSIGTPILNRKGKEKSTIGMFVNMISIPMHTNPDISIKNLITELSKNLFSYLKNSKYPYMDLLSDLKKHNSSSPYNIVFSFQNMRPTKNIENLIDYRIEWNFSGYSNDQLSINVTDLNNSGLYSIEYDYLVSLFNECEINYIHNRIFTIIKNIIINPNQKISEIIILDECELEKIISFSKGKTLLYDNSQTIVKLFEETVTKYPNEIALVHKNTSLTYSDLSNIVNVIANTIYSKGIHNSRIAVMCKKSIFMVASLLGVMKSGNCYIPIDPEYPKERIEYIINNSECKIILTTSELENVLPSDSKIILDSLDYNDNCNTNFEDKSSPNELAYMIYTSGTTGNPKGVRIKHKNIVNTLIWRKSFYKFSSKDAVLQIPSFSFDSSVEDIFTPLISGAKLVIPSSTKIDVNSISEDIMNNKITHFLVVPSLYKVLLNEKTEFLKYLSIITIAGESFPLSLIQTHFDKLPNVRIVNEYGPTENSVCSTYYEMSKNDNIIFIGSPIDNCYTYCLDNNLNILPIGIEGELYVSGSGVADGYFNKPDLTNERFISNPFVPGLSMYKTGDIVKLHNNGMLEFIGRKDGQVKLHGFRIELKEIEKVILENPQILDTAVVIKKLNNEKDAIIAYIVSDNMLDINSIYTNLRKKLPYYMIPTIMQIDKLPLTPNGKIDTKRLPLPQLEKKTKSKPSNKLETTILNICQDILNNKNLGVDDDLFIDGAADSLNILSISSRLFAININIPTQCFYKYPSVKQLAYYLCSKEYANDITKKDIIQPSITEYPTDSLANNLAFKYKNVFLTGATGFFGAHVLYQLLCNTDCTVYCLVREKTNLPAKNRFIERLNYYFGKEFYDKYKNRIIIIQGELSCNNFNLSINDYSNLQKNIDCIINAAAITKHYGISNIFYKENIKTVENLIQFCKNTNIVFNHISTTTVSGNFLVSNDISCNFDENSFYIGQNYEDNVYVYSKFEAEKLILEEEQKGLKANIFRLGNLMARHSDGQFQKNKIDNAYYCRLVALASLKCLPNSLENQYLEFTPVDDAALAVIKLLHIPELYSKIFHIFTDKLINIKVLLDVFSQLNINCYFTDYNDFIRKLHISENEKSLSLIISDISEKNEINYMSNITVKNDITNKYLEKIGFSWNNIDSKYLINFFRKVNFLDDLN